MRRSRSTAHSLFFPAFIHRILLHLGLVKFPAFETVHIVAPIGATFLRYSAAQLRASSKRPKVEPSGVAPPPPSSTGDTTAEELVDHAANAVAIDVPPPTASDDSDILMLSNLEVNCCNLLILTTFVSSCTVWRIFQAV